jgi:saccharopine dehydrogenase-like NADP-dependent oxidoreductase
MRVALVGTGAVGTRAARQLLRHDDVDVLTVVDRDHGRALVASEGLGERVEVRTGRLADIPPATDVVVIATASGAVSIARAALAAGAHVVAATDDPHDTRGLLALDGRAHLAGRSLVVGATMAPGLSCVLARWGAERLERVEEVHVASFGTGGPACARRHHAALSSASLEWYDGAWRRRPGGSGRELVWFPEPVGGADCYRGRLADPALLVPAFPGVRRVSARMEATRRDRFSAALPMLRPPHPEGTIGAARVELRGRLGPTAQSVIVGAVGRPSLVAGTVAAIAARWAVEGRLARSGAAGLAEMVVTPAAFLREVTRRGIPVSVFEGTGAREAVWAAPAE